MYRPIINAIIAPIHAPIKQEAVPIDSATAKLSSYT
jgi:hypothetical protein